VTTTGLYLKKKILFNIYKSGTLIRKTEEKIAEKYHEGQMRCPVHLSTGQEIPSSIISQIVKKKDFFIGNHRSHAHFLAKGGSIKKMLAEIYGKETGCSKGKGGSMHLIDLNVNFMGSSAIVGNSIPIGVGLGFSNKLNKDKKLSLIFFGDGAVEEGVFYESINFAILKKLPVIFICENNYYSVYSPLKVRQPKSRKIYKMVKNFGIRSYHFDLKNIFKTYKDMKKIFKNVREKSEPVFIEFSTYRWREHCGPNFDDELNYRPNKEREKFFKKDPLDNLKKLLIRKLKIPQKTIDNTDKQIDKKINEAFHYAKISKFPKVKSAFKGIYAK